MAPEKVGNMTLQLDEANLWHEVEPTIREFFRLAMAGDLRESKRILKSPAFAFACWCTQFPELVESLRGTGPKKESAISTVAAKPLYDPGQPMTAAELEEMAVARKALGGTK